MIIALIFGVSMLLAEIIRNNLVLPVLLFIGFILFVIHVVCPVTEDIWYFITIDLYYFIINLF